MGIQDLWKVLAPTSKRYYLPELAVREGFIESRHNTKFIVIGVDARHGQYSTWFYECQAVFSGRRHVHAHAGQNPELKALFYRLCWLSRSAASVVFVFDGPDRPQVKRGKHVRTVPHWMTAGFRELAEGFGFYCHTAPGEAEAELAYLNQIHAIDLVLTSDSDIFVFGATHVIRSSRDSEDRDSVKIYTEDAFASRNDLLFSQAGFLFLAVMCGGDYSTGLKGCGTAIACSLASGHLSTLLYHAITSKKGDALTRELKSWRVMLHDELLNDPHGRLGRKYPTLANRIPNNFPQPKILYLYCNPLTSRTAPQPLPNLFDWLAPKSVDTPRLAVLCDRFFGWGPCIIQRFRSNVWEGQFLRSLIQSSVWPLPPNNTPLGPSSIRYAVMAGCPGRNDPRSPSLYSSYKVEIWLPSVTIPAYNAVQDQLPMGRLAQGSGSVISLRLWVPAPIMTTCAPVEVIKFHSEHRNIFFSNPYTSYQPLLSDIDMCAPDNAGTAAYIGIMAATIGEMDPRGPTARALQAAARATVTYMDTASDNSDASDSE